GRAPESDIVCGGRLLTEDGAAELGVGVIYPTPPRGKPAADFLHTTPFAPGPPRFAAQKMGAAEVQNAAEWTAETRDRVLRPAYEVLTHFFTTAATEGQAVYKVMG